MFQMGCNFVRVQEHFLERSIKKSGLKAKEVDLAGDHIAYWDGGKGPALVLLHGFGADATFCWSEQIPALAKHFRLIVPDLLWFGGSKSKTKDFSLEHQANAVKNLLEHLDIKDINVAGISYGGLVAMSLLSDSPKLINKAVIIAAPGPVYTKDDYQQMLTKFGVDSPSELVLPKDSKQLDRLLNIAYQNPPYVPFFAKGDIINMLKDTPQGERSALLSDAILNIDGLSKRLKWSSKPVLIIWGSDDQMFPLELGERLKKHLGSDAELKVIEGGKHAPNVEFGEEFNKIVLDFL